MVVVEIAHQLVFEVKVAQIERVIRLCVKFLDFLKQSGLQLAMPFSSIVCELLKLLKLGLE